MNGRRNYSGVAVAALVITTAIWLYPNGSRDEPGQDETPIDRDAFSRSGIGWESGTPKVSASHQSARTFIHGTRAFRTSSGLLKHNLSALEFVRQREGASAAGDHAATYEIYLQVSSCRRAILANDQEIFLAYKSAGIQQRYAEGVEHTLRQCSSLASNSGLMNRDWITIAAEQGAVEARLIQAIAPEESRYVEAALSPEPRAMEVRNERIVHQLREAAMEGSLDALSELGRVYESGVLASQDVVQSYAYKKAAQRVDPTSQSAEELHEISIGMSQQEVAQAEAQSSQIYSDCCAL